MRARRFALLAVVPAALVRGVLASVVAAGPAALAVGSLPFGSLLFGPVSLGVLSVGAVSGVVGSARLPADFVSAVRPCAALLPLVLASTAVLVPVPPAAALCWLPPVTAAVADPFRAPACPWCPGNRGIEYATRPGDPVVAVTAGTVTFAGPVAGVTYISVATPDGTIVTYGRLRSRDVQRGDPVARGQRLGRAERDFILTVRRAGAYVDPAPMLGRWVVRPYLVPTDGTPPRSAPPPRLRCPNRGRATLRGAP